MTVTNQLNVIDNKIKANRVQYDLDRLAAKLFALSSGELRKYEYFTGQDLGYKPSVIEQTKFDYSLLGKVKFLLRDWIRMKTKKDCLRD